jgi:hypothetical protein
MSIRSGLNLSRRCLAMAIVAITSAILATNAHGQSTHGAIVGTATDPSKAFVPGLSVTITDTGTNVAQTVTTNEQGYYEALTLIPGTYRVEAQLSGFAGFKRDGIVVESRSIVRVDIALQIGRLEGDVVEVVASTPLIETETAAISDTRTAAQMEALPMLATGTLFPFVTTLPGVQVVTAAGSTVFSFNGARSGQSELMFDGMSSARLNTPLAGNPNTMEMTAEIKVLSSNNNAEFASPGVVNLISKSGTNQVRATGFYYHSRDQWNEKNRFQAAKPVVRRHNFGTTVSGPIAVPGYNGHDKSFFMFSYWGEQNPGEFAYSGQVPTAAMRAGDLSAMGGIIRDPLTGQPFPGNIIPVGRISPIAQRVQNRFYALPNVGDPNVFSANNWQENIDRGGRPSEQRFDIRADHHIGVGNVLFGRFNWKRTDQWQLLGTPLAGETIGPRAHTNFVVSDTHTFGHNLINEARFGFTRGGNSSFSKYRGRDIVRDLGLAGYPDSDYYSIPNFIITGMARIGNNVPNNLDDHNNIYQATDVVTWSHGKHTSKAGIDVQYNTAYGLDTPDHLFGTLNFTGLVSGNAYADFLLGLPANTQRSTYVGARSRSGQDVALFVQDSWRVGSRLTLEGGLRYEYQFAVGDDDGLMYNFDPATGNIVIPDETLRSPAINPLLPPSIGIVSATSAGFSQALRNPQTRNIVPRAGFAWRVTDKTVVRGGYGVFIDSFGTLLSPASASPLFGYVAQFTNTTASQLFTIANPFGSGGGSLVGNLEAGAANAPTFNPNLRNPRLHQWSLSVERQIKGIGARASYIGSRTTNLTYVRNINLPEPSTTPFTPSRRVYPQFANVFHSENGDGLNSQYHGLQLDVEQRFGSALYVQGAWTASRLMEGVEDLGREAGPLIQNPYDVAAERARGSFPTHRVNGAVVWELPFGRNRRFLSTARGALDAIVGGWRLSSLFYFDSGRWFTPMFTGADPSGTGTSGLQRPGRIGNGNLPKNQRSVDRWFDTTAFVPLTNNIGRFGNSGRNVIEGPSTTLAHLTVAKRIRAGDRATLHVQMNALNVFNIENFELNPNSLNISPANSASAGKLLAIRPGIEGFGARAINVEVRLDFDWTRIR